MRPVPSNSMFSPIHLFAAFWLCFVSMVAHAQTKDPNDLPYRSIGESGVDAITQFAFKTTDTEITANYDFGLPSVRQKYWNSFGTSEEPYWEDQYASALALKDYILAGLTLATGPDDPALILYGNPDQGIPSVAKSAFRDWAISMREKEWGAKNHWPRRGSPNSLPADVILDPSRNRVVSAFRKTIVEYERYRILRDWYEYKRAGRLMDFYMSPIGFAVFSLQKENSWDVGQARRELDRYIDRYGRGLVLNTLERHMETDQWVVALEEIRRSDPKAFVREHAASLSSGWSPHRLVSEGTAQESEKLLAAAIDMWGEQAVLSAAKLVMAMPVTKGSWTIDTSNTGFSEQYGDNVIPLRILQEVLNRDYPKRQEWNETNRRWMTSRDWSSWYYSPEQREHRGSAAFLQNQRCEALKRNFLRVIENLAEPEQHIGQFAEEANRYKCLWLIELGEQYPMLKPYTGDQKEFERNVRVLQSSKEAIICDNRRKNFVLLTNNGKEESAMGAVNRARQANCDWAWEEACANSEICLCIDRNNCATGAPVPTIQ